MEGKDILAALNLPTDLEDIEKIVSAHGAKFIPVDTAHENDNVISKITGKITGSLTTEAKRLFDFEAADIKDKDLKTILKEGTTKLKSKIEDLEKATNNDERYNALKKEHDSKMILFEQTKTDLQKTAELLDNEKKSASEKIKGFKTESILKSAKEKLAFKDGVTPLEMLGFNTTIKEKYVIDLDEQDNPIVLDKAGKKVPNKQKAGEYLGLDDVLKMELSENGLEKKNNLNGRQPFTQTQTTRQDNTDQTQNGRQRRPISQRALDAEKQFEHTA